MKRLALVAVLLLAGCKPDPVIELDARNWHCTNTRTTIILVPMMIGKMMFMRSQPFTECVEYRRR